MKRGKSKGTNPGRARVSEEQVEKIHDAFKRSTHKFTRRASRELVIPHTTVWRVLKRRLHMKPCKLSLVQALTHNDKDMRREFCESMLEMVEDDETLFSRLGFRDEATFHLCGTVNWHNVRIWFVFFNKMGHRHIGISVFELI